DLHIKFVGFLSVSVVWFTNTIDTFLGVSVPELQAVAAGSIFLCIVMVVWIISFGSENDSFISKIINSWALNKSGAVVGGVTDGPITLGPVQEQLNTVVVSPNADYAYKARALYDYQANPEDQNELSLIKGEVLDIVDNKGKWWQARKADGAVGIAPSNYVSF
ncbi:10441_t:CDS:2, partial [Diversispora eburnea]